MADQAALNDTMISRAFDIADSEYPSKDGLESNEWEDARWYAMLRALIIDAFNPPDDDAAECSLLADSVVYAFEFIESAPCECKGVQFRVDYGTGIGWDWDVCSRCQVLGRINNERQDR